MISPSVSVRVIHTYPFTNNSPVVLATLTVQMPFLSNTAVSVTFHVERTQIEGRLHQHIQWNLTMMTFFLHLFSHLHVMAIFEAESAWVSDLSALNH